VAALKHQLGLDLPILTQYICWITNIFKGDWGISLHYKQDVLTLISGVGSLVERGAEIHQGSPAHLPHSGNCDFCRGALAQFLGDGLRDALDPNLKN
jgi:hypothetical protein